MLFRKRSQTLAQAVQSRLAAFRWFPRCFYIFYYVSLSCDCLFTLFARVGKVCKAQIEPRVATEDGRP